MTVLVAVETVLLVLLLVLVAGLLRSHAEILRRLGPAEEERPGVPAVPGAGLSVPSPAPGESAGERRRAPALVGVSTDGDAVRLDFERGAGTLTLLAFLSSGCGTCGTFWASLAEPRLPPEVQTVIVTRGSERERPAAISAMAPAGVPVVMSSAAWEDYRVPGTPYFVLVDDTVLGEGAATTWAAVASLVGDAVREERAGDPGRWQSGRSRARQIDETLAAGGIGPGHPSLYPASAPEPRA